MKTKKMIALILLSVLALSCQQKEIYNELTEAQKQLIPYELGRVVSFIDNITEQVISFTVIRDTTIFWFDDCDYSRNCVINEKRLVKLLSELDNSAISLSLDANRNRLQIHTFHRYFDLDYDANAQFETVEQDSYKQYLRDSIEINNNMYYDVVDCISESGGSYNENGETIPANTAMQLFYNKSYGILQIKREGKNVLTINQ